MAEDTAYQRPPIGAGGSRPLPDRPGTVVPPRAMRARRRRPAVLALAVALIAAGGLGGAALYTATGQRVAVLALARDVPSGATIKPEDLTEARVDLDPALAPLSASSRVVGMRATTDLLKGSLLTARDVTSNPLVQSGEQVVGVAAKSGQLPATPLHLGWSVLLVTTPSAGSGTTTTSGKGAPAPTSYAATVVDVGPADSTGQRVVDVAVPSGEGAAIADLVASGRFAVVISSDSAAAAGGAASRASGSGSSTGAAAGSG